LIEIIIKLQCKARSVVCGAALTYFPKFLDIAFVQLVSGLVAVLKIAARVLLLLLLLQLHIIIPIRLVDIHGDLVFEWCS